MEKEVLCYPLIYNTSTGKMRICLAVKKFKIGAGLWNGYGGHIESGEKEIEALKREFNEEAGAILEGFEWIAQTTYFERPEKAPYRQLDVYCACWSVSIYITKSWTGKIQATKEMGEPKWFNIEKIPYGQMMSSDRLILPLILVHVRERTACIPRFEADVYYGPGKEVVEWVAIRPF